MPAGESDALKLPAPAPHEPGRRRANAYRRVNRRSAGRPFCVSGDPRLMRGKTDPTDAEDRVLSPGCGYVPLGPTYRARLPPRWTDLLEDGQRPIGNGTWIKRMWRTARLKAGIGQPIPWHGLRHEFVSLLIGTGKHPRYISAQAGWSTSRMLDVYGHLFETLPVTSVEWWDDLIWPPEPGNTLATKGVPRGYNRQGEVDT